MIQRFDVPTHTLALGIVVLLTAIGVAEIPLEMSRLPAIDRTDHLVAVDTLPAPSAPPNAELTEPALTDPSAAADAAEESGESAAENESTGDATGPEEIIAEVVEEEPWYAPSTWVTSEIWEGEVELGLNGFSGNSKSLSLRAGIDGKRETEWHITSWDLTYAKTQADSVETQRNAIGNLERKWLLDGSLWTLFGTGSWEYDEFKAFDGRLVANAGLGIYVVRDDVSSMYARLGTGTSREFNGPADEWVPEAVWGLELERQLTERQKISCKMEFLPDWSDYGDFRYTAEAAWKIVLDEAQGLSLKLSARDRYDSTPNGALPNDLDYALLLLWNL